MPEEEPSSSTTPITTSSRKEPLPTTKATSVVAEQQKQQQQQQQQQQLPSSKLQSLSALSSSVQYQQLLQQQQQQQQLQQRQQNDTIQYYEIASPQRNTISYQLSCLVRPIPFSICLGTIYTLYTSIQNIRHETKSSSTTSSRMSKNRNKDRNYGYGIFSSSSSSSAIAAARTPPSFTSLLIRNLGTSIGIVYVYYIIQCPMEAIHQKESYIHNGIAAFTLSYIGLMQQNINVPFIPPYSLHQLPLLTKNILGASMYSIMAMYIAAVYGRKKY